MKKASRQSHDEVPLLAFARPSTAWRRAALLAMVCIALAWVASTAAVHEAVIHLLAECERLIDRHPLGGPLAFIGFSAVSAMAAFLSVAVIVPVAVFAWGPVPAALYLWFGWILGGLISYGVGRSLGRGVLLWLSPAALTTLQTKVQQRGSLALVLLLQLSLPSEVLGYGLGSARYPFKRYLPVLMLGELPYALGAVALSDGFVARRTDILLGAGLAMVALILIALHLLRRQLAFRYPHVSTAMPADTPSAQLTTDRTDPDTPG